MADNFHYEKLVTLNNVYHNTLIQCKTEFVKPNTIKTELYPHQSTMVQGMYLYRDKMTRGFLVGNQAINGKIGIIGDPPGTGKTLSILTYLARNITTFPRMTCELSNYSSKYFFSHNIYSLSDVSSANLIVVPHSLFGQWRHEIEKHTTMKYIAIETKRIIKGTELAQNIVNSSFVLTTNSCYKYIQEYSKLHGIEWNNVFIDEASSIYMNSSDPPLQFQFLWLVTNNWIPLLFKNPSIHKTILYNLKDHLTLHIEFEKWLLENSSANYDGSLVSSSFLKDYISFCHPNRDLTVLRNDNHYIYSNLKLPDINIQTLQCRPNITLQSLISYYLARNIEPNIRSQRLPYLFQSLGVQFKDVNDYLPFQIQTKYALIKRKVEDNECVICLERCEYPTIVNCCYHIYCGKCLLKNTLLNSKCPTCRETILPANMCCLKSLSEEETILAKNKSEVCLDLFKNHKDDKFIIYSAFDNIYYQLFEEINHLGLKAERIENNLFSLLKTIKNFKQGLTNILFVSNIELIRGLSLESISHLIFYHDQPSYELKQVLTHSAQRMGRQQPLKIHYLHSEIQV